MSENRAMYEKLVRSSICSTSDSFDLSARFTYDLYESREKEPEESEMPRYRVQLTKRHD